MTPTPEQNAKRVIELSEKATEGPWRSKLNHKPYRVVEIDRKEYYTTLELKPADADLIATYRTAAPELAKAYLQAIQAIQSAPHEPDCQEMRQGMPLSALRNGVCKCWKAPFMKKHPNGL